jgi:hypothetical protein
MTLSSCESPGHGIMVAPGTAPLRPSESLAGTLVRGPGPPPGTAAPRRARPPTIQALSTMSAGPAVRGWPARRAARGGSLCRAWRRFAQMPFDRACGQEQLRSELGGAGCPSESFAGSHCRSRTGCESYAVSRFRESSALCSSRDVRFDVATLDDQQDAQRTRRGRTRS